MSWLYIVSAVVAVGLLIYLVAALLGMFFGVGLVRLLAGTGGARGGLAVDEAQVGCVLATVRVATLVLLYVSAGLLLQRC